MAYDYKKQRENLFTDAGQRLFLRARDHTLALLRKSGAIRCEEAMSFDIAGLGGTDSWDLLACVDRMVELGELVELPTTGAAQYRVFVKALGVR